MLVPNENARGDADVHTLTRGILSLGSGRRNSKSIVGSKAGGRNQLAVEEKRDNINLALNFS